MGISKKDIGKLILRFTVVTTGSALCMAYPFLPGEYDILALPVSIIVQACGTVGLLFSVIGFLWFAIPTKCLAFSVTTLYLGALIVALFTLFAFLAESKVLGVLIIFTGSFALLRLKRKIIAGKNEGINEFSTLPFYLAFIPLLIMVTQVVLAKPLTHFSRNSAIANANEYITHLEKYHSKYGRYPPSLQALHKDYKPKIAGIEKYHYLQYGNSFNLSFEQPRFLLDVIGTREWVVYNPRDEHKAYSHTAWFLLRSPAELENSQGWYETGYTGHPHWKYFFFD